MNNRILNVGYIGNGKSANRYHIPFVLTRPETFRIKTIYAPSIRHDIWAAVPGVVYTEHMEDLLGDPEIDLVVVNTPHNTHYQLAKQVLEAGKNCLVEKPFTETPEQAQELFSLADEKGLYCSAYQNRRYDSDFLTVLQVMESGKLGELLELESHYDYFRPYVPNGTTVFDAATSFVYTHACHTLDQVISCFGKPDRTHYDVRQLLGEGRMNDYFDIDLYYGILKVSVKSSFFRLKGRPSFVLYGKKGMFVKEKEDRQEYDLKRFYLPAGHPDFGMDTPEDYGTLTYLDDAGTWHEEKVPSVRGDYARVYDNIYDCIVNGKPQVITHDQTLLQIQMLREAVQGLR